MVQHPRDHDEVRLAPLLRQPEPEAQLLVVGGGLSGLSAAEAAVMRGIDVVLI
jgi:glycerol-3-phosphate dehydrogenase